MQIILDLDLTEFRHLPRFISSVCFPRGRVYIYIYIYIYPPGWHILDHRAARHLTPRPIAGIHFVASAFYTFLLADERRWGHMEQAGFHFPSLLLRFHFFFFLSKTDCCLTDWELFVNHTSLKSVGFHPIQKIFRVSILSDVMHSVYISCDGRSETLKS